MLLLLWCRLYAQPVDFDEDYDKLQLQAEAETHVSKTRRRIMRVRCVWLCVVGLRDPLTPAGRQNSYANSPASAGKKGKKKKKKKKKRQSTQPTDSGESDGGSSDVRVSETVRVGLPCRDMLPSMCTGCGRFGRVLGWHGAGSGRGKIRRPQ